MQHTDDIDPAIERQVEDNVPPERKTAYAWRQFVAGTTHHRLHCEYPELLVEAIYPAICRGDTVIGNVVPDFEDIRLGEGPPRDPRHSSGRGPGNASSARRSLQRIGIPGFARTAG